MIIHFEKIDRSSVAYAGLCKIIYDTIKSHHQGFWISTEDEDAIKAEKDKQMIKQIQEIIDHHEGNHIPTIMKKLQDVIGDKK